MCIGGTLSRHQTMPDFVYPSALGRSLAWYIYYEKNFWFHQNAEADYTAIPMLAECFCLHENIYAIGLRFKSSGEPANSSISVCSVVVMHRHIVTNVNRAIIAP